MTAEKLPQSVLVRYKDENIYADAFSVLGSVEMYSPKTLLQTLGIECQSSWSWKPEIYGNSHHRVDIDREADVCVLAGKEVRVKDAAENALRLFNDGQLSAILPAGYKVEPLSAEVYDFGESENQCLRLVFQFTYDGIPVEGGSVSAVSLKNVSSEGVGQAVCEYPICAAMLTENSIDWLRLAPANLCDNWFKVEEFPININYEKACTILSNILSDEQVFDVEEARLMYAVTANSADGYNTDSYEIKPKWRFHLVGIKAQEFAELYVYI
ncbi:MAG: hypothetical protein ACI4J8_03435, partial [Oscillospiraceae bacterium]